MAGAVGGVALLLLARVVLLRVGSNEGRDDVVGAGNGNGYGTVAC